MANYEATARSNYFAVRDRDAFAAFCNKYDLKVFENQNHHGLVAFAANGCSGINFNDDEDPFADFDRRLSTLLDDGQVCVYQEVGQETGRYVTGYACAVNWLGDVEIISLDDIYQNALKMAGPSITVTDCCY